MTIVEEFAAAYEGGAGVVERSGGELPQCGVHRDGHAERGVGGVDTGCVGPAPGHAYATNRTVEDLADDIAHRRIRASELRVDTDR